MRRGLYCRMYFRRTRATGRHFNPINAMEIQTLAALCLIVILGCFMAVGEGLGLNCTKAPCKVDDKSIRFFVLGDWGGTESPPYTTAAETLCAKLIDDMSVDKRPQFFVSTGDNFYEWGVQNEHDPRFKTTFDDVFLWGKKEKVPWYVVQGNHDWYGNGSAQIAYTFINDRWVSPNYAFKASYDARPKGPSVDMLYIDTIVMCGNTWNNTDDDADYVPRINRKGKKADGYFGPDDPVKAEYIWFWIVDEMAKSKADYLFVVGHYPMFASDWHNVSWCLVPKLQNLMEKYHATAYLCGHAHNVQHVSTISRVSGHPIHHVLSGAGHLSKTNYLPVFDTLSENPWNLTSQFFFPMPRSGVPKKMLDRGALVYVDLGPESGTVEYYKCNGERMYSFEMKPRKRPT